MPKRRQDVLARARELVAQHDAAAFSMYNAWERAFAEYERQGRPRNFDIQVRELEIRIAASQLRTRIENALMQEFHIDRSTARSGLGFALRELQKHK